MSSFIYLTGILSGTSWELNSGWTLITGLDTDCCVLLTELPQEEGQNSLGAHMWADPFWRAGDLAIEPVPAMDLPLALRAWELPSSAPAPWLHRLSQGGDEEHSLVWKHYSIPAAVMSWCFLSDIMKLELYKNIILWVYKLWVIAWIYKSFYFKSLVPFLGQVCLENNGKNLKHPCCKATWFQMNIKLHESWSLLCQSRPKTLYLQTMQQSFKGAPEEIVLSWNQDNYYIVQGFDPRWIPGTHQSHSITHLCNQTEERKTVMDKDRERSLFVYQRRQNRLDFRKLTKFIINQNQSPTMRSKPNLDIEINN